MVDAQHIETTSGTPVKVVKYLCRKHKIRVNKGPGFYLIDHEDYLTKIKSGSVREKQRTLTKSHLKKMMDGKAAKKN